MDTSHVHCGKITSTTVASRQSGSMKRKHVFNGDIVQSALIFKWADLPMYSSASRKAAELF